jgi:hypothetical protein
MWCLAFHYNNNGDLILSWWMWKNLLWEFTNSKKVVRGQFFFSWNTMGQSSRKQRNYDGDDQGKCNLLK